MVNTLQSLSLRSKTIPMLFEKYQEKLEAAISALHDRTFYAAYPEHPKAYGEEAFPKGKAAYEEQVGKEFKGLNTDGSDGWIGEEESPYTLAHLGITYPKFSVDSLISKAEKAGSTWKKANPEQRAGVLIDSLERVADRFFELALATQHTTGQSFMMSFQASGPHANDRSMEAIALGYEMLNQYPSGVEWEKPMGKFSVKMNKTYTAVPKGISLAIGCSTFPTWNTVPGVYASLITGNPVIIKPHPKAVYPIAIVVAEIQAALEAEGFDPCTVQLAVDESNHLITRDLAEHPQVKLIDYTGSSVFGDYVESIPGKTVFTEKAGVNSVILDSVDDMAAVFQNLAMSVSLYSGQMCTAPQNFFISESGVKEGDKVMSYEDVVAGIRNEIIRLVNHPKMGPGVLGAVQNPATLERANKAGDNGGAMVLDATTIDNPEFESARICTPAIIEVDASKADVYENELFGPIIVIVKTRDVDQSIEIARNMAEQHGAITCLAYSTDDSVKEKIRDEMESVFVPVTFNLKGTFIFVNQHAAFSDFHVTGGNPAGNASFTNNDFITRRFVWVGHRELIDN